MTAGTVFHRTRTDLPKWFVAAYLMGRDKRGVSAKFLQRELGVSYQTAWTMAHKLRHGLSEDQARPLRGFLEADETLIGGRGAPDKWWTQHCQPRQELGRRRRRESPHRIVGMTYSAPARMPVGQRAVTVLRRV